MPFYFIGLDDPDPKTTPPTRDFGVSPVTLLYRSLAMLWVETAPP